MRKLALFVFIVFSCSKTTDTVTPTPTSTAEVPAIYKKIYGATSVTSDGTYITIKTKDLPDHKSAYYATTNALYQAYTGTTFGGLNFAKTPILLSSNRLLSKFLLIQFPPQITQLLL